MDIISLMAESPSKVSVSTLRGDMRRRSVGYEAVFLAMADAIALLCRHHLLQQDAEFSGLIDAMIGVEDSGVFHDRVLALVSYVNQVADSRGALVKTAAIEMHSALVADQKAAELVSSGNRPSLRTRIQVR